VRYCSADCQRRHWGSHRHACHDLAERWAELRKDVVPSQLQARKGDPPIVYPGSFQGVLRVENPGVAGSGQFQFMKQQSAERQSELSELGLCTFPRDFWQAGVGMAYPFLCSLLGTFLKDTLVSVGNWHFRRMGAVVYDRSLPEAVGGVPVVSWRPMLLSASAEIQKVMKKAAAHYGLGLAWQVASKGNHGSGWHYAPLDVNQTTSRIWALLFCGMLRKGPRWARVDSFPGRLVMSPEGRCASHEGHSIFTWFSNRQLLHVRLVCRRWKLGSYAFRSKRCMLKVGARREVVW
jgi:hypothetical protein